MAPLSGVVFRIIGLPQETARKAVLFGAARGVLSAAVRLGIVGSYGAQQMQHAARAQLDATLERCRGLAAEEICQTRPSSTSCRERTIACIRDCSSPDRPWRNMPLQSCEHPVRDPDDECPDDRCLVEEE